MTTVYTGQSLTIHLVLDGVADADVQELEVTLAGLSYSLSNEAIALTATPNLYELAIPSNVTKFIRGKQGLYVALQTEELGLMKTGSIVDLSFETASVLYNGATGTAPNIVATITVEDAGVIADTTLATIYKGDQGEQGVQGVQGLKGDKGDKGDPGDAANAISSLGGLTVSVQTFATGTAGSDFNISSSAGVHTFNIPDAATAARGLVNFIAQSFKGVKTFLDEMFTRKITITGAGTTSSTSGLDVKNSAGTFIAKFLDNGTIELSPVNGSLNLGTNQLQIAAISNTTQLTSAGNWRLLSGSAEVFAYGTTFGNISFFDGFTAVGANIGGSRVLCLRSGTAPTTSLADNVLIYSADIAPGKAALHLRTEDGKVIKLYCQDTSVGSAAVVSPGTGTTITTDTTIGGYSLAQIVQAMKNNGSLQ